MAKMQMRIRAHIYPLKCFVSFLCFFEVAPLLLLLASRFPPRAAQTDGVIIKLTADTTDGLGHHHMVNVKWNEFGFGFVFRFFVFFFQNVSVRFFAAPLDVCVCVISISLITQTSHTNLSGFCVVFSLVLPVVFFLVCAFQSRAERSACRSKYKWSKTTEKNKKNNLFWVLKQTLQLGSAGQGGGNKPEAVWRIRKTENT